jgi:putative peptide zinc metalloprotease protein
MTTTAIVPERAEGLQLLGALGDSGYTDAPGMVRRADGRTLQLTPLLYAVLEELNGDPSAEALASRVSSRTGRDLSASDVAVLVEKLAPLGVLRGTEGETEVSNPLLGLRWKVVATNPETTNKLTAPFAALFNPLVLWPVLAAFVAVCWFVLVEKGLASATRHAFDSPGLLLTVFALGVLSAGIHELGHAAACRYGGATPGAMGAGIYLVWPAFYTNVDDSYRLNRRGRLRVDLGGLYFNALIAVAVAGIWLVTRQDALLLGVALQLLQMLRQLAPIIRADGYHILADLTGVPDLFMHLGPTLRRMLPWHWHEPSPLTRRARWIVTTWVLIVVPLLLLMLVGAALLLPRLIASAWQSAEVQWGLISRAADSSDVLAMGAGVLKLFALALPVLGTVYLLVSVVRRTWTAARTKTQGRPVARGLVTMVAGLILLALLTAWWPQGQYEPVRGDERGTLGSLLKARQVSALEAPSSAPVMGKQLPAIAMVPRDSTRPTMLLVQRDGGLQTMITGGSGQAATAFPFTLPKAPGPGDNQALAVNSSDGSVVYDVSYALVTVTDGADVTSQNTAYALASCTACTTVAVAFEVVLIIGQSNVVVPVNAAVAGNSGCIQCVTSALAVQLVATLTALPDDEVKAKLDAALAKLDDLDGLDIGGLYTQVMAVQNEVVTILKDSGHTAGTTGSTATATATPVPSGTPSATPAAETSTSPDPSPTATPDPSQSPSPQPDPSTTPTP